MKKIAVIFLTIAFLASCLVVPVMAASPKKIPVTVTDGADQALVAFDVWYSETGEIAHISLVFTGHLTLHVDGQSFTFLYMLYVEGNGPEGFGLEDGDKVQHDPTEGVFHVKEVWTYVDGDETDTFEGVAHWTMNTLPYIMQYSSRIVLQGSGVFKGQTLSLAGEFGISKDNIYRGTLLIP